MIDEPSLRHKALIFHGDSSALFLALAALDCTMSRENLKRMHCFLCGRSTRNILSTLIMEDGG